MVDEKALRELYESTLKPELAPHETHRKSLLRATLKHAAVGGLLILTAFLYPVWIFLAILAGLKVLAPKSLDMRLPTLPAFRRRFKGDVVERVFRLIHPEGKYLAHAGISRARFEDSGLFTTRVTRYESEDLFRGRIQDTTFEAAEVRASYTTGRGDTERNFEVLSGMVLRLDFNKHLSAFTIVQPEGAPPWRMGDRAGLEPVTLENPEFERRFAVFASDPVEARYILTPLLMERVLTLSLHADHPLHLSFLGNHVHLAVHYGHRLFEPSVLKSVSFETIRELAELFDLAEVAVRELDLNVRIWTKGPAR